MSKARRASVSVTYEHVNITDEMAGSVKMLAYTDVASGESDAISLSLQDREKKWMGSWAPKKGDNMSASMTFQDWDEEGDGWSIYCGTFEVDDISMSGPPPSCTIGAVSIPRSTAFNEEERTKNWEEVTVKEIAEEIASRAGISLYYEAEDIPVWSMEQDKQTDCKFLYSVCEKYGLAMKVFAEKIVIFDEAVYEAAEPVTELKYEDFAAGYQYKSKLEGTYTGAKIAYSDPITGEDHIVTVGGGDRIKEINEEADSAADAQKKAIAALNNANKKDTTFSGTVKARRELLASRCIRISGFGVPDGTYYLDKVVTKVSGGGASKQSIEAHKVGYRMDNATVLIDEMPEETETDGGEYTVVKGDTLWKIAAQTLGTSTRYAEIYELNKDVIEETAKGRGKKDSSNGHWLFQGTILKIPGTKGSVENGQ
ncbi:MAG: LysM peptidoglycan-binding domain-containing protein [Lachnospiraceae bacterium]|nr:LysM peptidoglycan-binding domain-containing protein [Lachnospiraceae bacterium]